MAKFNTKSISNRGVFLSRDVKMYETSMKPLQIQKFSFKTVLFLTILCKMYLKILQKLRCLGCILSKRAKRSAVTEENRVEFLGQFRNEKLSFVHKKETEHSLKFPFPFVFQLCIFNREMQTLVLKTTTWSTPGCHFVENRSPVTKIKSFSSTITYTQLTDSDWSIISKARWNNGGQKKTLSGEEWRNSCLPRACLRGGGELQVGEVTRLDGVINLSI